MDRATTIMIMTLMATFLYGQLQAGNAGLAYGRRLKALGALAMFLRCITLG